MLMLLVFGAGGVGFAKCACSGRISFLVPLEQNCCPVESDCMTITVVHFSASELQQNNDITHPMPVQLAATHTFRQFEFRSDYAAVPVATPGHPPTGFVETTVLRV